MESQIAGDGALHCGLGRLSPSCHSTPAAATATTDRAVASVRGRLGACRERTVTCVPAEYNPTRRSGAMRIELPDDVIAKTGVPEQMIKEIIAVSLYKLRKINGVQGGKILGTSEFQFHEVLGKYGETFSYDVEDLMDDLATLEKLK
jgi:predicted HTH domain antitoxin